MTIQEVVCSFNTTPFIFAGSGITRRYYGLPDWRGLLSYFAKKVSNDDFAYRKYENNAKQIADADRIMPQIASLIEKDYNEAWFNNINGMRSDDKKIFDDVAKGISPFKAAISSYLSKYSNVIGYEDEIQKLKNISKYNISGIITTNYDEFFENLFEDYRTFIGQDELVFSQLQGVAEIYKIHGSISKPESIVINREDYDEFSRKRKYLAAKLMTIFMEYPIIFIGYSITDPNIREILYDIVQCLPDDRISLIQKRFIFVEYNSHEKGAVVSEHSILFDNKTIKMSKITLSDFGLLYDELTRKKAAFPIKLLRRFKDDLYDFVLTNEANETMRVAPLDDERIDDDKLAITIGLAPIGRVGLGRAVDSEKWYKNVILHDLKYDEDDLLQYCYLELAKQNSWKIPVWYYLNNSKEDYPEIREKAPNSYEDIVTYNAIKRTKTAINNRSMKEIWDQEKCNIERAIRLLGGMPEENTDVVILEEILKEIFEIEPDCLLMPKIKSNVKKLIRIFDYIKYSKQNKRPRD